MDGFVSVEPMPGRFGEFRGVLFMNHPTPSGADRYRLRVSTDSFPTAVLALERIGSLFPQFPNAVRDLPSAPDISAIPVGAEVVVAKGRSAGENGCERTRVEVLVHGRGVATTLTESDVSLLVIWDVLELDSISGDDPDLEFSYRTYVRTR